MRNLAAIWRWLLAVLVLVWICAAARLAGALWEVARLHAEVAGRGVDAVLADVRAGRQLSVAAEKGAKTQARLAGLGRALDREAHHLRDWDAGREPGHLPLPGP